MKNKITLILLFFTIIFNTYSSQLDSLTNILNTTKIDTSYLKTLIRYSFLINHDNIDSSIFLTNQVIKKCKEHKYGSDSTLDKEYNLIRLRSYSNLLIYYRRTNNFVAAMKIYEEATPFINNNNIETAHFFSNYANVLIKTKDIQGAYNNYIKSREIYEKKNNKLGVSATYFNIGRMFYNENDFENSINNTQKALDLLKNTDSKKKLAFCLNSLASSYSSMAEQYKKKQKDSIIQIGIKYYKLSLEIKKELKDYTGQLVTLNNLSEIYTNFGEFEKALKTEQEAENISKKQNNPNKLILTYIHYCRTYRTMSNYPKALEYGNLAYKLSIKNNNVEYQNRASNLLSSIYKNQNNFEDALKYYEIYMHINDSILRESHLKSLITNTEAFKYKHKNFEDSVKMIQQSILYQLEIKQNKTWRNWLIIIIILIILLSFFIYKDYKNKVKAKELLTKKTTQIEKQNKYLEEQKADLEEMNKGLTEAYNNKVDSIKYAKKIQATTFPTLESIKKSLPKSFIIYKPLDIVSGDFYWIRQIKDEVIIAVGDSTGHGVPGAFLSIMGIAILKEMVNNRTQFNAAEIMGDVRKRVIESLQHYKTDNPQQHYGMDLGLIIYNKTKKTIQFSGANTPLYIINNASQLEEKKVNIIEADKMPISMYPKMEKFTNHCFQLENNDSFYMFTDGTIDQFGGLEGKKIGSKNFTKFLYQTSLLDIKEQKNQLNNFLSAWQLGIDSNTGEHFSQTDDITILGVRI